MVRTSATSKLRVETVLVATGSAPTVFAAPPTVGVVPVRRTALDRPRVALVEMVLEEMVCARTVSAARSMDGAAPLRLIAVAQALLLRLLLLPELAGTVHVAMECARTVSAARSMDGAAPRRLIADLLAPALRRPLLLVAAASLLLLVHCRWPTSRLVWTATTSFREAPSVLPKIS